MSNTHVLSDHISTIANGTEEAVRILHDGDPIEDKSLADAYYAILRSTINSLRSASVAIRTYETGIDRLISGELDDRRSET